MYPRLLLSVGVLALSVAFWPIGIPSTRPANSPAAAMEAEALTPGPNAIQPVASGASAGNGLGEVSVPRAPDGHFYLDAQVNGATVHFLVDTGASTVALTRADAQAAGVQFASGDFTGTAQTAGGQVALKPVLLDRVATGPLEARSVQAVVVDSPMGISLLGQSWLARIGTVTITGDRMVLR